MNQKDNDIILKYDDKKVRFFRPVKSDYITEKIEKEGTFYELDLLEWLNNIELPAGDFIDIGANIGNHTVYFAKVMGRKVSSYEPYEPAFKQLKTNVEINNISRKVKLYNFGLSSQEATADVVLPSSGNNIGAAKTVISKTGETVLKVADNELSDIKKIALIKIDVEGHEREVLKGAKTIIKKHRPLLLVECQDYKDFQSNSELLYTLGYAPIAVFGATPMVAFYYSPASLSDSRNVQQSNIIEKYYEVYQHNQRLRAQLRNSNENSRPSLDPLFLAANNDALSNEPNSSVISEPSTSDPSLPTDIHFSDHILIVNRYPSESDLYSYAFVHARVKAYQQSGLLIDVFRLDVNSKELSIDKFEGVRIFSGSLDTLEALLKSRTYKTISTHLLTKKLWTVLEHFSNTINTFIWIHGAEIQPWYRRHHLYTDKDKRVRVRAVLRSKEALDLWRRLFTSKSLKTHFIFVSRYLASQSFEDLRVTPKDEKYSIIHNYINEDLFKYIPKDEKHRKKILAIRSFDNENYANDLLVDAIVNLSKKRIFKELEFTIVGDGKLFNKLVEPIRGFTNVHLHKKHLTQQEIAELHAKHGIFLSPTRMDTQGVSRDEAMSSGLVPITNKVAAIPEFVDNSCGFVAPPEDSAGLATAIEELYDNPSLFLNMSKASATRVREQSGFDRTIKKELELLEGRASQHKPNPSAPVNYSEIKLSDRENETINAVYDFCEVVEENHKRLYDAQARIGDIKAKLELTEESLQHQKRQAIKLRNQNRIILASKSYRLGSAIVSPLKKIILHPIIHSIIKRVYYLVYPDRKKILQRQDVKYADLYVPPKARSFELRDISSLKNLKIAAIMDDFTYSAYSPECHIKQLSIDNWKGEIDDFMPDVVLVESAWRGKDGKWRHKVSQNQSESLLPLVRYAQQKGIPTAFWNKEDPAHTAGFLPVASMVDFVFTTDMGCVPIYRDALGHNRVFILPFAAQPTINNPIEKYERQDKFNFAGSYYVKYKERCLNFNSLVDGVLAVKGIDIYDRNYDRGLNENYQFPDSLQEFIKGSLPYEQIDKAYKGYNYAININTIKYSPTMFARRVFELLASNTITVSNYSQGVKNLLGDLVISSDDGKEATKKLKEITKGQWTVHAYRLAGLREVMAKHTYAHRLNYFSASIFSDFEEELVEPGVLVVAQVESKDKYKRIIKNFDRQNYEHKQLLIVDSGNENLSTSREDVSMYKKLKKSDLQNLLREHHFAGLFDASDYYGPNYLTDLMMATKYSDAEVIGKSSYYKMQKSKIRVMRGGSQYQAGEKVVPSASIVKTTELKKVPASKFFDKLHSDKLNSKKTLSIDEFSYCQGGQNLTKKQTTEVNGDLEIDTGKELEKLYKEAEVIANKKTSIRKQKILKALRIRRTLPFRGEL